MASKPAAPAARDPPAGDDGPDDPRQLAAQFDLVQRELQRVDRRLAALEQALVEAQQAAGTVTALAEAGKEVEALMPVGSGVHLHARVDASRPVLMPLGAGYYTEDKPASVASALAERVDALGRQFQEASQDAERLAQAAAAINERLLQIQQP